MEHYNELLNFFKVFSDKNRLRLASALIDEALPIDEIAALLNITQGEATRHIEQLMEIGFVKFGNAKGVVVYRFDTDSLGDAAKRILARPKQIAPAALKADDEFDQKVLSKFLNVDGSIKEFPAQPKKFEVIVHYVLRLFKKNKRYTEKEVNEIIKRVHPDSATLRRSLIDYQLMQREKGIYWRVK